MKLSISGFFFGLMLVFPILLQGQSTFKNCKAEGRAKKTKKNPKGLVSANFKAQNLLKNRDYGPADPDIDSTVTLAELLKKSNDKNLCRRRVSTSPVTS